MNIQTTIRPQAPRPAAVPQQNQAPKENQPPKDSWGHRSADYLERSNNTLTTKLASLGGGLMLAQKGVQISEGMHPAAKAVWIVGAGLVGAGMGYAGGSVLQGVNSTVTNALLGSETSLSKSVVSTGLNTAVFGLVGGWTGAAIHAVATVGGAATLARQDLVAQG